MLFAKQLLTEKEYNVALQKGVSVFLYNEINFAPNPQEGIQMVNCTTERVPSTWYTWEENERIFSTFEKKHSCFHVIDGFDFSLAIKKAMFWANMRIGYLEYTRVKYFVDYNIFESSERLFNANMLKTTLKYAKEFLLQKSKKSFDKENRTKFNWAILIEDTFQINLYKHILYLSLKDITLLLIVINDSVKEELLNMGFQENQIKRINQNHNYKLPFPKLNLLKIEKNEWFLLDQLCNHWNEINQWYTISQIISNSGVKKFLMNEGENGVKGSVIGEVLNKRGIQTFNTMNGMKSGQAQDAFQSFQYWFVWGIGMKKMLIEKCALPESMLINVGHLMEDEIANYRSQGSFDSIQHENKKIISLFSVRGKREEKMEAFRFLYDLAEQKSDLVLLIRKHPSEKDEDLILPTKDLPNVYWVEYNQENSKNTLYDQLSISTLSICFGSTVALESKWFGVPCITFEMREESLVYLTDDKHIFHVKEILEFESKMSELLAFNSKRKPQLNNVASQIVEELRKVE